MAIFFLGYNQVVNYLNEVLYGGIVIKLSIIVPVYNVEAYLHRCLESLSHVTFSDREIILVDDGSTDSSGFICDLFQKNNKRVKVIHQENKGVVVARLAGVKVAEGEFVSFVDSDDWIDKDLFNSFVQKMEREKDVDICIGGVTRDFNKEKRTVLFAGPDRYYAADEAMHAMVFKETCHWFLVGKVYRKELFANLNVNAEAKVYEDLDMTWEIMKRVNRVWYSSYSFYHYYINSTGVTKSKVQTNYPSWRVFGRIIAEPVQDEAMMQRLFDGYIKVFMRHTFEAYFMQIEKWRTIVNCYFNTLRQDLRQVSRRPSFLPQKTFTRIISSSHSCVMFYQDLISDLQDKLICANECHGQLFLYGSGVLAEYVSEIAKRCELDISAYVVSDGQAKTEMFLGKPVYYLSEVKALQETAVFLLAVDEHIQKIVRPVVEEKGYTKIIGIQFPSVTF